MTIRLELTAEEETHLGHALQDRYLAIRQAEKRCDSASMDLNLQAEKDALLRIMGRLVAMEVAS